jgi:hypothetical protein
VFLEKSLWRGVGLRFVASCTQKPVQGVQYALIIIDDKYPKVGQRHSPHQHWTEICCSPRPAYRNAAFNASTAKKMPPSDKANNLAVALSFIASELLC